LEVRMELDLVDQAIGDFNRLQSLLVYPGVGQSVMHWNLHPSKELYLIK